MGKCRRCKKDVGWEAGYRFRDEAAYREYRKLGECQECQDEVFGIDNRPQTPEEHAEFMARCQELGWA